MTRTNELMVRLAATDLVNAREIAERHKKWPCSRHDHTDMVAPILEQMANTATVRYAYYHHLRDVLRFPKGSLD